MVVKASRPFKSKTVMEAKKLEQLIKERGIKQSFIADKLRVSNTLVSQWVKGTRPVAERHVVDLKRILSA